MNNSFLNTPIERFTRMLFSRVIEGLALVINNEHLSFSQVAALHIIDRQDGVNINDISSRLNLSLSASSRLIDELVKSGLVNRREDVDNRRSKILSLSAGGKIFMDKLSVERVKIVRDTAHSFSEKIPLKSIHNIILKLFKTDKEGD